MKKQLLSKIVLSCIMFGGMHAYGSSIVDQIYAATTTAQLDSLKRAAAKAGSETVALWGQQKQAISKGSPLTNPAGGGAPAAFPSQADVQKFAQCIQIARELLEQHSTLGGDFATLDTTTNIGSSIVTITDANVTTAIGTPRKSYNLGTLGKQPADHGKKGKRTAMTPAEKKRHKDLVDRKDGRHNKVMQDKKAPHKKAPARGGKKAGNVKAQAMNNQHRKVS